MSSAADFIDCADATLTAAIIGSDTIANPRMFDSEERLESTSIYKKVTVQ